MRRRTVLASLTAGIGSLAGCSTTLGGTTETPTTTPTEQPTESPTPTSNDPSENEEWELGAASIIDLTTANRTYALAPLRYRSDDGASIQDAVLVDGDIGGTCDGRSNAHQREPLREHISVGLGRPLSGDSLAISPIRWENGVATLRIVSG